MFCFHSQQIPLSIALSVGLQRNGQFEADIILCKSLFSSNSFSWEEFCCSIIHPDHAVCFREQIQAVGDEKDNAVRYHLTQVFKHFYFCCLV